MAITTIYPEKDTWLDSINQGTNYGTSATLRIGSQVSLPTITWNSILHCDLTVLPAGTTINSAQLDGTATQGGAIAYNALVQRLTQPNWVEDIFSNWTDYDKRLLWTVLGGDFTAVNEIRWNVPTAMGPFSITGFKTLCDDAIANRSGQLHFGLMEDGIGAFQNKLIMGSGENADSGKWPRLVVDHTLPHLISIDGSCVQDFDQIITVG